MWKPNSSEMSSHAWKPPKVHSHCWWNSSQIKLAFVSTSARSTASKDTWRASLNSSISTWISPYPTASSRISVVSTTTWKTKRLLACQKIAAISSHEWASKDQRQWQNPSIASTCSALGTLRDFAYEASMLCWLARISWSEIKCCTFKVRSSA